MSGTYTGDCVAADFLQIDAAGGICEIQYKGGDMVGVSSTVSGGGVDGGTFSASWTVPVIPSDCSGETVYATASGLYDGGPPGIGSQLSYTESVSGSFTLACECSGGSCCSDGCHFDATGTVCRGSAAV